MILTPYVFTHQPYGKFCQRTVGLSKLKHFIPIGKAENIWWNYVQKAIERYNKYVKFIVHIAVNHYIFTAKV